MGLTKKNFDLLNNSINMYLGDKTEKSCLELGNQEFVGIFNNGYVRDNLSNQFKKYTTIDLHAVKGVTSCDLSLYQENLFNVDLITNFGTTEHVEYEIGQYNCWKNIHNWLNINGIAIHLIPEVGSWKGHCRYYTNFDFYKNIIQTMRDRGTPYVTEFILNSVLVFFKYSRYSFSLGSKS
jgi:hypothetical protein